MAVHTVGLFVEGAACSLLCTKTCLAPCQSLQVLKIVNFSSWINLSSYRHTLPSSFQIYQHVIALEIPRLKRPVLEAAKTCPCGVYPKALVSPCMITKTGKTYVGVISFKEISFSKKSISRSTPKRKF